MKKKILIISGIVILLAILGGGGYALWTRTQPDVLPDKPAVSSKTRYVLKDWKDPLGFTLSYPDFLKLNPHDEDKENYAHLEFTASPSAGRIVLWAQDPPDGTLDEWIALDEDLKDASSIDTTWGGETAQKISVRGKNPRIVIATVYDDLLFLIELYPDTDEKFTQAYDEILTKFVWQPSTSTADSSGDENISGGEDVDSGEEVVE